MTQDNVTFKELTHEEVEEIKKVLQLLRPNVLDRKEYQYTYEIEKKVYNFVYSYEFLVNLYASITNATIKEKLNTYIMVFKPLYNKYYYLMQKHKNASSEYTKRRVINELINDYNKDNSIETVISFMRPLGKKIQFFNPEEHAGMMGE